MATLYSRNHPGIASDKFKIYLLIFSSLVIMVQFLVFERKWNDLYARVENWTDLSPAWYQKHHNYTQLSPESDSKARKLGSINSMKVEEKFEHLEPCMSGKRFNGDEKVDLTEAELACLNDILHTQKLDCHDTQSGILEALKLEVSSLREKLSLSLKQLQPSKPNMDEERTIEHLQKELKQLQTNLAQSVTFLNLKDTREPGETNQDTNWFMSSLHGHPENGKPEAFDFPSEESNGRVLCLQGNHTSDGTQNKYAFAWKGFLPPNSVFLPGVTLVADNYWNYENIWHGMSAMVNFAAWRSENGCIVPDRLVLYHWGELVTTMGTWLNNVLHASLGRKLEIETLDYAGRPVCFERAVVHRRGLGGTSVQNLNKLFDMVRCRVRIFCKVEVEKSIAARQEGAINLLILLRTGPRAFNNDSGVINVVASRCERVKGCRLEVVHISNLSFCEQVKLLSRTDILVTSHGAQLTNIMFMSRGSSVMEMFPKGWLKFAGIGQNIYKWLTDWTGLHHEGAWHDTEGPDCPYPVTEVLPCLLFHKDLSVGLNETHLSTWTADVLQNFQRRRADLGSKMEAIDSKGAECACNQIGQDSAL
ncbi:hypothetical protein O6H91_04G028000 [Diphasiastrum complanatum]|uniref:Uncharacterized protein n=4 Tax=Diphasiastrum complanatum TaxID=34168 RepID=A0ACC2DVH9_DIPCM|nr:hypothetical protein O6H91_Y204600 [Diphasiastrum complanatum]KAJ7295240.1 hypothetical protein O6H91_Y204600 [Diphasiastrum complanatum]KAJ7295241.1 hypothetical protein O6H91_Y204600 [Diphasiastrum complanatum]KAJ7295242.1 hypothetical protein O6H91_Y204600 [Diphasiastrum complanatum]KAJ7558199.1 hypothetical protein O6H91_04G028000 [Diphasiastrum complanatum]